MELFIQLADMMENSNLDEQLIYELEELIIYSMSKPKSIL